MVGTDDSVNDAKRGRGNRKRKHGVGHVLSPDVARKHYLQTTEEHFERAAGGQSAAESAAFFAAEGGGKEKRRIAGSPE